MVKRSAKKRTHRQRRHRQRAGGWGFTGSSSIPGTPGIVSNPMVYTGIGDCRAAEPGYQIPYSQYANSLKGLPGMSGGKRRTKKQRGGRYGFFPESIGTVTPNGAAWWAGTYPPIQRIACEGSTPNPLNPGPHTPSTAPPGAANPDYWMKGGKRRTRKQRGGQQLAPATYGVGNVDSMYYYAPTAGYANTASTWKDSVGAPVQIQVPYAAREMNQACLSTGGHPPLTGALQKGGKRKGRKTRRTRKQRGGISLRNIASSIGLAGTYNTVSQQARNLANRYGPAGFGGPRAVAPEGLGISAPASAAESLAQTPNYNGAAAAASPSGRTQNNVGSLMNNWETRSEYNRDLEPYIAQVRARPGGANLTNDEVYREASILLSDARLAQPQESPVAAPESPPFYPPESPVYGAQTPNYAPESPVIAPETPIIAPLSPNAPPASPQGVGAPAPSIGGRKRKHKKGTHKRKH